MQESHKLAIVIPFFKREFFLETLKSLSIQSDRRFKVYIGNDASPAVIDDLVFRFEKSIDIKYVLFDDNLGSISLVRQWQRCIDLIDKEEWITILGDDDLIPPNFVKLFYEHIDAVMAKGINVIRFASQYIDEQGDRIISNKGFTHPRIEGSTDSFYKNHLNLSRSSLSEHIFSRKRYETYGFTHYPLAWHSDDKAWLDFTEFGDIYTINEECVSMRMSKVNISGRTTNLDEKWTAKIQFYSFVTQESNLSKFDKKQQKKIFLDYCSYLKMTNKFNFIILCKAIFRLFKIGDVLSIFYLIRMYLKKYDR